MTSVSDAKARLRAEMRSRRAGLSTTDADEAGAAVTRRLESLPAVAVARRVAAYRAVRGEIPLDGLLDGERREVFTLPRVMGDDLEFLAWRKGQTFAPGSFGIPEPVDGEVVAFADHDAVLVPLTAFDGRCHRLGQGGGFYDRALASLLSGAGAVRPVAIGVAYSFQQVAHVPQDRWDVPLDAVATDAGIVIADGGLLACSRRPPQRR
ncbi:MAG: 5-formyltetrahydrofolate cyclo-ligase [Acidimicrobiaceae bacterium]|nr:5-formyltetrahydrofolate cyclo-ligase [Acidimicrobiaceae bacterium]